MGLAIKVSIPDLSRHWLSVSCPQCRLEARVQFRDVEFKRSIVCRGCKSNLKLFDAWDSFRKTRLQLERQILKIFQ